MAFELPKNNPARFEDAVVLVTGGGSGIGAAAAKRLAWERASVICLDVNADGAESVAEAIRQDNGAAIAVQADVREKSQIEAAIDSGLTEFGRITHLVNNAGTVTMTGLPDLTETEWDLVLDVNLKGQFLVAQAVGPKIAEAGGGAIVCTTTVESMVIFASGPHCQPHYNASKAGVRMLMKALAHELGPANIRVNAVAPGGVATPFTDVDPDSPEIKAALSARGQIPRLAEAEEVAAAMAFLLSNEASYITGTQIVLDGGWLIY